MTAVRLCLNLRETMPAKPVYVRRCYAITVAWCGSMGRISHEMGFRGERKLRGMPVGNCRHLPLTAPSPSLQYFVVTCEIQRQHKEQIILQTDDGKGVPVANCGTACKWNEVALDDHPLRVSLDPDQNATDQ